MALFSVASMTMIMLAQLSAADLEVGSVAIFEHERNGDGAFGPELSAGDGFSDSLLLTGTYVSISSRQQNLLVHFVGGVPKLDDLEEIPGVDVYLGSKVGWCPSNTQEGNERSAETGAACWAACSSGFVRRGESVKSAIYFGDDCYCESSECECMLATDWSSSPSGVVMVPAGFELPAFCEDGGEADDDEDLRFGMYDVVSVAFASVFADEYAFVYEKEGGGLRVRFSKTLYDNDLPFFQDEEASGSVSDIALTGRLNLLVLRDVVSDPILQWVDTNMDVVWTLDLKDELDSAKKLSFYDAEEDSVYLGGTKDGERRFLRIDNINSDGPTITWARSLSYTSGTATLLLRKNTPQQELLLVSNSFYARLDAATGAELFKTESQSTWFLTGDGAPIVAYDASSDAVVSAGGETLRVHSADDARQLLQGDLDLSPALESNSPADRDSDYPEECPSGCASSDYFDDCPPGDDSNLDDRGSNCFRSESSRGITAVHAAPSGIIQVVGFYKGDVYGSEGNTWYSQFVAEVVVSSYVPTYQPTRSPTRDPTRDPTRSPTRDPTRPPTTQTPTATACDDSTTWFKKNVESKDCAWVAEYAEARCLVKNDAGRFGFEDCKSTCGACGQVCVDDPSWVKAGGDATKDCVWVKQYFNRCGLANDDGVYAYDACRNSCQTCSLEVSCQAGSGAFTDCEDSSTWFKNDQAMKECEWVAAFPEARCYTKSDTAVSAYEECRDACGACGQACVDDDNWVKSGSDTSKDCEWVKLARNHRCALTSDDGTYAADACSHSCLTCDLTVCPSDPN